MVITVCLSLEMDWMGCGDIGIFCCLLYMSKISCFSCDGRVLHNYLQFLIMLDYDGV